MPQNRTNTERFSKLSTGEIPVSAETILALISSVL
jgi:hypothetical protein